MGSDEANYVEIIISFISLKFLILEFTITKRKTIEYLYIPDTSLSSVSQSLKTNFSRQVFVVLAANHVTLIETKVGYHVTCADRFIATTRR